MMIDIYIKFREDSFQVIEWTRFVTESKGNNAKSVMQELWFLCSAHRLMLTDI